jgi:hypothetical protein
MSETVLPKEAGLPVTDASGSPPPVANAPDSPRGTAKVTRQGAAWVLHQTLTAIASLKVTVVLFALSIVLVFLGTLAQVDEGIWTVLTRYFRTGIAWIPLQALLRFAQVFLFVPKDLEIASEWAFPYPGGWLLGGLLLLNLVAAHAVRFRITWKRSGILLLHSGLIVLMLSELFTGLFAVEGRMSILEGASADYTEDFHATELAVVSTADDPRKEDVVVIPDARLRRAKDEGAAIRDDKLPFDVKVVQFMTNSTRPAKVKPGQENPADAGDGREWAVRPAREVSGTDADQTVDIPAAYVTFTPKGGGKSRTYLLTVYFSAFIDRPQRVTVGDKDYRVSLRFKRTYKDYSIELLEFHHDVYMGTQKARNFSSKVRLVPHHGAGGEREVVISMNHPLRYGNETFYQSSVLGNDEGTVLQVVDNPGWLAPYFACGMVTLGMLIHFSIHLYGFIRRRVAL